MSALSRVPADQSEDAQLSPDDAAGAMMFFCDRDSGFVAVQTLYVCGGASVGTIVI